jgi:hypothetical protein
MSMVLEEGPTVRWGFSKGIPGEPALAQNLVIEKKAIAAAGERSF